MAEAYRLVSKRYGFVIKGYEEMTGAYRLVSKRYGFVF